MTNLQQLLQEVSLDFDELFFDRVVRYKQLLLQWNKTHNLTGAKNGADVDVFIVDALYPLTFITPPKNLLDIGTGAGFPGLLLAMALPDTQVTLCEPLIKRVSFLQFIKATLQLKNVTVMRKKAEELTPFCYELITSRAVTDTKVLLEISKKLRDEETRLLFYKGENVFSEIDKTIQHKIIIENNRHYLLMGKEI